MKFSTDEKIVLLQETQCNEVYKIYGPFRWLRIIEFLNEDLGLNLFETFFTMRSIHLKMVCDLNKLKFEDENESFLTVIKDYFKNELVGYKESFIQKTADVLKEKEVFDKEVSPRIQQISQLKNTTSNQKNADVKIRPSKKNKFLTDKEKIILMQETEDSLTFKVYGEKRWMEAINFFESEMNLNAFEIFYTLRSRYMRKALESCGKKEYKGDKRSVVQRYFDGDVNYKRDIYLGDEGQRKYVKEEKNEFKKRVLKRFKELKEFEKIKNKKSTENKNKSKNLRF